MTIFTTRAKDMIINKLSNLSLFYLKSDAVRIHVEWVSIAWKVSKYGVFLVCIFPYSVQMQENVDQKNSVFG